MLKWNLLRPRLWVCLACLTVLASCLTVEKTKEVHTVTMIDTGTTLNNGVKIASDEDIEVVVYMDGKAAFRSMRRLNGMSVLTPDRYIELIDYETALVRLLENHRSESASDIALREELNKYLLATRLGVSK